MNRLTGQHFTVMLDGLLLSVEECNIDIEDSSTANSTNGVPDGYLQGAVKGSGEIKLSSREFKKISEVARNHGSWRQLPAFDVGFSADSGDEEMSVEAFGCRFKISSLLSIKGDGGEKNIHTLPFEVTAPEFIKIDGVAYIEDSRIKNLV